MDPGTIDAGQVWKKIKCDGTLPTCGACVSAATDCARSKILRRQTKIRGFKKDAAERRIAQLQAEVLSLKEQLARTCPLNSISQEQSTRPELTAASEQLPANQSCQASPSNTSASESHQSLSRRPNKSSLILKHMGRMVQDGNGNERFAGSTTGVHFVLTVQQALCSEKITQTHFPECCYRLHSLAPAVTTTSPLSERGNPPDISAILYEFSRQPLSFYARQIAIYSDLWSPFCPVIAGADLVRKVNDCVQALQDDLSNRKENTIQTCFQLLVIQLLNEQAEALNSQHHEYCWKAAQILLPHVSGSVNLMAMQGLVLFSLYIQTTGRVTIMPQINGLLVMAAHQMGLHRHARRFKFSAAHVEMRRRLWWSVYAFDKVTAITHGLPQLIQDVDIDVDYPIDCTVEELDDRNPILPLPGESTSTSYYLAYVRLARILGSVLKELYTTTHRRNAAERVCELHDEIMSWKARNAKLIAVVDETDEGKGTRKARLWLSSLSELAVVLIHRPALTFDDSTREFARSLDICVTAYESLIRLMRRNDGQDNVLGIVPLGPSLAFQAGLIQIYRDSIAHRNLTHHSDRSNSGIERAVLVLEQYQQAYNGLLVASKTPPLSYIEELSSSASLLRSLWHSMTDKRMQEAANMATPGLQWNADMLNLTAPVLPSENVTSTVGVFDEFNSLESLNQFGNIEWSPSGAFNFDIGPVQ